MNSVPEEFSKGYSAGLPAEFSAEWFDYSSKMWMMNKRKHGQSYEYVCKKEKCKNKCHLNTEWCKWHQPPRDVLINGLRRSPRLVEKN
jgi:hypothetical protein